MLVASMNDVLVLFVNAPWVSVTACSAAVLPKPLLLSAPSP